MDDKNIYKYTFHLYTQTFLNKMNSIVINNMDMIKISHVMTVYTIKNHFVYVYNSVSYVYNIIEIIMKYVIYVLQAR